MFCNPIWDCSSSMKIFIFAHFGWPIYFLSPSMPYMDLKLVYLMFISFSRSYHNSMCSEGLSIANEGVHVFMIDVLK